MPRTFFVGGNLKMNGTAQVVTDIIQNLNKSTINENTEVVVAPSPIHLHKAQETAGPRVAIGAQNVFDRPSGAFTGELSVSQLQDLKISWTLTGHSERREIFKESDEFIASKTKAAIDAGISVILCIGESLEQREKGVTNEVCKRQLDAAAAKLSPNDWSKVVIAYEPVWAIGTGKVATAEQAQEAHNYIRNWLKQTISAEASENTRIIYGGSVSAKNSKELAGQPDIDGFLVGGASLKPEFVDIVNSRQ